MPEQIKENLFEITAETFERFALALFQEQAARNPLYREYLSHLGRPPALALNQIPFLPIQFFKNGRMSCFSTPPPQVFRSSGTGGARSERAVYDPDFGRQLAQRHFEQRFGPLAEARVFGLLPGYLDNPDSSLVDMVSHFGRQSAWPQAEVCYRFDFAGLHQAIWQAYREQPAQRIFLFGVSFALLDMAETYPLPPNVYLLETGGMKGRREEITRSELHQRLKEDFGLSTIFSEYGMAELSSQAYTAGGERFFPPPWMEALVRRINEPFALSWRQQASGRLLFADLANWDSCAFLETEDLGRVYPDGSFDVLGRLDGSEARGCNLLYTDEN